jgi:hypothetical protein
VNKTDAIQLMRARWSDGDKNGKYEMIVDAYKRASLHLGTIVVMIREHNPGFRKSNAIGNGTAQLAKQMLRKLK